MRYEIKYAVPILDRYLLDQMVLTHPASFVEAFPDRIVHNVYYDNAELDSFYQNIDGSQNRQKIRLRWYNDQSRFDGRIEIKKKRGVLGFKDYVELEGLENISLLLSKKLGVNAQATLTNQYKRSYYISADNKFRLTIDADISYTHPLEQQITMDESQHIIEVKFEEEDYPLFDNILRYIPLRQTKFSKYVNGLIKISS